MKTTATSLGAATFNVSSSSSSGLQVTVYTYSPTTTPTTFTPTFSLSEMPSLEKNTSISPTDQTSTLSTGAIIGIVVGVIVFILLLVGLYLYYTKYYNNNTKKERLVYVDNIEEN